MRTLDTQTHWEKSEVFYRKRSYLQQAVQVLFSSLFFAVSGALLGAVGVVIVLQDCNDIMMAEMNGLVHGSVAPPVWRSRPKFKEMAFYVRCWLPRSQQLIRKSIGRMYSTNIKNIQFMTIFFFFTQFMLFTIHDFTFKLSSALAL